MNKFRDESFDFIKGILIILVVLGHAIQMCYGYNNPDVWYNWGFNIIYTFHMPLFIFVSGYFFPYSLKKNFKDMIANKFKRLLLPAFFYSSIIFIITAFTAGNVDSLSKVYTIYRIYWYLICIFALSVLYYIFYKSNINIKLLMIIGYILSVLYYNHLPYRLLVDCQIVRQTLIFGLGTYFSINKEILKGNNVLFVIVTSIFIIILWRICYGVNILYYPPIARISDGIACSLLVFIILRYLYNEFFYKYKYIAKIIWLGQNSLAIYLIHIVLTKYIQYNNIIIGNTTIIIIASFTVLLSISIFITFLLKRIKKHQYIFGV